MTWWADNAVVIIIFIVRTHCPDPSINILISTLIQEMNQTTLGRLNLLLASMTNQPVSCEDQLDNCTGLELIVKLQILKVILLSKFYCKLYCYDLTNYNYIVLSED